MKLITLTAEEYEVPEDKIRVLCGCQKRYMSAVNLYAKRYLCEKLKKRGMKTKEIAEIVGVSENHIYKLQKCNADFWFLEQ